MSTDIALLVRVAASLTAVVLLALVAAQVARRGTGRQGRGDLCVRDRVGLTRETAAVVLETDGRRLLVGVSPGQVTLLADLGTSDPVAAPLGAGAREVLAVLPRQTRPSPATPAISRENPLSRRAIRELDRGRRLAAPPAQRGTGSVLDPRTWQQGLEALRNLTARHG
jgi:flagellar biogenesis protein FliO